MKTTFKAMLFYLVMAAVVLTGCPTELDDDVSVNSNGGTTVTIRIRNGGGNALTIQDLAWYRLTFSGGPAHYPVNIDSGTSTTVFLSNGRYTISATAYSQAIGEGGTAVASGSISVTLSGGAVTSNNGVVPPIVLRSLTGAGEGG
jgi:type 1 fimbria pilin